MITTYRIVKKKWSSTAFDGEGARLNGGRWNSVGKSCVYLAGSESLAILEVLVHLNNTQIINDYELYVVEIQDEDIMFLNEHNLPDNWREDPAPQETAEIGDDWLSSHRSVALSIPSTIAIREMNYIININHPKFKEILKTATKLEFSMDLRLVK